MSIATAPDFEIASTPMPAPAPIVRPLLLAAACVALADWLFWGWPIGISLALFLGLLGVVAIAVNQAYATRKIQLIMTAVFVASLLALVENVGILSAILASLATGLFVIVVTAPELASWQHYLIEALATPVLGQFHLTADVVQRMRRENYAWLKLDSLVAWIIPLGIFAIFIGLFASANPLIEHGLLQIDLLALVDLVSSWRMVFWTLLAGVIWPLILRRSKNLLTPQVEAPVDVTDKTSALDFFFDARATGRSLILFNALFALQSGLDLVYLWGGANLPDGMSHAEYAHRGAYPLIATALLAAGFVLIAMRPGGPAEHSRLIRPLVLAWIAQNILLVASSIFRLDLYVATFSLTYLRLAAFIWMALVAVGLLLILIQIVMKKPNSWLLAANAISLALVLYGCCFINAPRLIASYNIEHSREVGGAGPNLDLRYLASLGPQALPALEAHVKQIPALWPIALDRRICLDRDRFLRSNWRSWGFRAWRLQRYLANNPDTSPVSKSDGG